MVALTRRQTLTGACILGAAAVAAFPKSAKASSYFTNYYTAKSKYVPFSHCMALWDGTPPANPNGLGYSPAYDTASGCALLPGLVSPGLDSDNNYILTPISMTEAQAQSLGNYLCSFVYNDLTASIAMYTGGMYGTGATADGFNANLNNTESYAANWLNYVETLISLGLEMRKPNPPEIDIWPWLLDMMSGGGFSGSAGGGGDGGQSGGEIIYDEPAGPNGPVPWAGEDAYCFGNGECFYHDGSGVTVWYTVW